MDESKKRNFSPFKSPSGRKSHDVQSPLPKKLAYDTDKEGRKSSFTNTEIAARLISAADEDEVVQDLLYKFEHIRRRLLSCLKELGYSKYRNPFQEAAAISVSSGQCPTAVRSPTGGGKSLVYLLPAMENYLRLRQSDCLMESPFLTIVMCPLVALCRDQRASTLKRTGFDHDSVIAIDGDSTVVERSALLNRMNTHDPTLFAVYFTSSYLVANPEFQGAVVSSKPYMFVLEEAHTLRDWCTFVDAIPPAVEVVRLVLDSMPSKRIALLTATMEDKPLDGLLVDLGYSLTAAHNISSPRVRPNVSLVAGFHASAEARDRWDHIARWIIKYHPNDMVVVYMQKPDEVESAYKSLSKKFACVYYHGQMTPEGRSAMNELIDLDMFQVVVANIAYGLGIDKAFRGAYIGGGVGSITDAIQLSGRPARDLSSVGQCYFCLNPFVLFRSYCLYWNDYNQLAAYNLYLRTVFNAGTCLQCALGLWDYDICGSNFCETRCDVCLGMAHVYQVDIAGAAVAVVGDGGSTSRGLFSNSVNPELSFNDTVRTWALLRSFNDGRGRLDNPDLPPSLLPTVLLLLCAHEFLVVSADLTLKPASPALISRLFNEVGYFSVRGPRTRKI